MGGYGSGQAFGRRPKRTTNDLPSVDIRFLCRQGVLEQADWVLNRWYSRDRLTFCALFRPAEGGLQVAYMGRIAGKEDRLFERSVGLVWTKYHFGGKRPLFRCPGFSCGNRVAILYFSRDRLACRRCLDLAYPSQRESPRDRVVRRADRIRKQLGWTPGILNGSEWKPKHMHWKTFERLSLVHDRLVIEACQDMMRQLTRGKS